MKEEILELVLGGLLHDIGKIVYRTGRGKYHGDLGADLLSQKLNMTNQNILNQVRLHHVSRLKNAKLEENDLTYITYVADNISAGVDRRVHEEGVDPEPQGYRPPYGRSLAMQSIFNVLQKPVSKDSKCVEGKSVAHEYLMTKSLEEAKMLNFTEYQKYTYEFYKEILEDLVKELNESQWNSEYLNSVAAIMEKYASYIPSSTCSRELADISLYDHSKLTAAFGCCIYEYLQEQGQANYKDFFLKRANSFYQQEAFLYYVIDISGIQDFIYTIHSDGALKNLRARSFYLEILVEHIADELLERLGLSRVNLLYTGGGHAQFILPNTQSVKDAIDKLTKEVNLWLQEQFDIQLFMSGAYCTCCAKNFMISETNLFQRILSNVQEQIQTKKLARYTAVELEQLNDNQVHGDRECKVCHHSGQVIDNGECDICKTFRRISRDLLNPKTMENATERQNKELYVVTKGQCDGFQKMEKKEVFSLPLPMNCYLYFVNEEAFLSQIEQIDYLRVYSKNAIKLGCRMETHLWVGDYNRCNTLEESADKAIGVRRIGVLRADVDNLSDAFIQGFVDKNNTLSRRTMLSGRLSLFFKYYINSMLQNGITHLKEKENQARNITVVYSGGDDVFVIGSWDDIVGFAVDLHDSLSEYSQQKLTISAGIGIYPEKYPVSQIAYQVGELEDCAKNNGKDSIALFDGKYTFKWDIFIQEIYKQKYKAIYEFFEITDERGISFLYHLLELLVKYMEDKEEKISLARYAFLLARLEPQKGASEGKKDAYREFARKMYQWIQNDADAEQTIVAIYLYLYIVREDKKDDGSR